MAANNSFTGTTDDTVTFDRPVRHLNVSVGTGVTFSFSLDGINYLTLPAGFHSFPVGPTEKVYVSSSGQWGLIGVQG